MKLSPGTVVGVKDILPSVQRSAMVLDEEVSKEYGADRVWVDLNTSGIHLPQMYRRKELFELPEDVSRLGLCATCRGYGSLIQQPIWAGPESLVDPCEACSGTGRSGLRVAVRHEGGTLVVEHQIVPHEAVPIDINGVVLCQACSMYVNGHP